MDKQEQEFVERNLAALRRLPIISIAVDKDESGLGKVKIEITPQNKVSTIKITFVLSWLDNLNRDLDDKDDVISFFLEKLGNVSDVFYSSTSYAPGLTDEKTFTATRVFARDQFKASTLFPILNGQLERELETNPN